MKKKVLATLLCGAMVLGLTGCGGGARYIGSCGGGSGRGYFRAG